MAFIDTVKPLVTGPFLRTLAVYIEIVTFALTLIDFRLISIIAFSLLGIVWITDLILVIRKRKHMKIASLLDLNSVSHLPGIPLIVYDFLFGGAFVVIWIFYIIQGVAYFFTGYSSRYYGYSIFGAHAMIGCLSIAHLHIFFASCGVHLLRQEKNGKKAANRAQRRDLTYESGAATLG